MKTKTKEEDRIWKVTEQKEEEIELTREGYTNFNTEHEGGLRHQEFKDSAKGIEIYTFHTADSRYPEVAVLDLKRKKVLKLFKGVQGNGMKEACIKNRNLEFKIDTNLQWTLSATLGDDLGLGSAYNLGETPGDLGYQTTLNRLAHFKINLKSGKGKVSLTTYYTKPSLSWSD